MKRKRKRRSEGQKTPSLLARTLDSQQRPGGPVGFMPGRKGTERVTITDPDGAWRSMRRAVDTIDVMFRRRQIDKRQLEAAEMYRKTEEALRGTMPCTLDLSRARGGGGVGTPTQVLMIASETMESAHKLLGKMDSRIVSAISTDGHSIDGAAKLLYPSNSAGKQARWVAEHVGRRFREALTILAEAWFPRQTLSRIVATPVDKTQMVNVAGAVTPGKVAHSDRLDQAPQPKSTKLNA